MKAAYLLLLLLFVPLASAEITGNVLYDNFNRADNGSLGGSWVKDSNPGSSRIIHGNTLRIYDTSNLYVASVYWDDDIDYTKANFKLKTSISNFNNYVFFQGEASSIGVLYFGTFTNKLSVAGGNGSAELMTIVSDTFYDFEVFFNDDYTFTLYTNGVYNGTYEYIQNTYKYPERILFQTCETCTGSYYYYIDDVILSSDYSYGGGWGVFSQMRDNLVTYIFGNYLIFGLFLLVVVMVLLISARINPVMSFIVAFPVAVGSVGAGYFSAIPFIGPLFYLLIGLIWAFIMWRLLS